MQQIGVPRYLHPPPTQAAALTCFLVSRGLEYLMNPESGVAGKEAHLAEWARQFKMGIRGPRPRTGREVLHPKARGSGSSNEATAASALFEHE